MEHATTGQFLPTPKGKKTPKMLEVERRLGCTLEEDFHQYYRKKEWGQKRLADRWGVGRNLIFAIRLRGGRRSWAKMLNLRVRPSGNQSDRHATSKRARLCEICDEFVTSLDKAHWISDRNGGGTQSFNILHLCPNCHRKLDRDDLVTTRQAKEILLFREAERVIETGRDSHAKREKLLRVCEAIITRSIN